MAVDLGGKGGGVRPTINITPLVDVVLVLLIIFMVVTPLLTKHFSTTVPEPPDAGAAEAEPDDSAVVVTVDRDGTIRLNQTRLELDSVTERVREVFRRRKERIVFFDADGDAPFGVAVDVMDRVRAGGVEQIAVATEPIEGATVAAR